MQSVPVTTKVVSSNPIHGEVYSIPHSVIQFVSYLRQVGDFPLELRFPPPIKLTATRGVTTLGSSRHVHMHKCGKSALNMDALYNFRTSFSVVVSCLETPKTYHDEKVALYLNAILLFVYFIYFIKMYCDIKSRSLFGRYLVVSQKHAYVQKKKIRSILTKIHFSDVTLFFGKLIIY